MTIHKLSHQHKLSSWRGFEKRVGNSRHIHFWTNKRSCGGMLKDIYPHLFFMLAGYEQFESELIDNIFYLGNSPYSYLLWKWFSIEMFIWLLLLHERVCTRAFLTRHHLIHPRPAICPFYEHETEHDNHPFSVATTRGDCCNNFRPSLVFLGASPIK